MIRRATPADAPGIARAHVETWRAAYAGILPAAALDALSVPAGASRWAGLLAVPESRTWVALRDGDVVGFATAGPPRDADLDGSYGEVYAAYVRPAAQRAGLGRALLDTACGWLAETGRDSAALWVLSANAQARAFYATCGWCQDGAEREIDVGGAVAAEARYRINLAHPAT